jgi:hypothetical protein
MRPCEYLNIPPLSAEQLLELERGPRKRETYVRESPPLRPEDREVLDQLPTIHEPTAPAVVLLWREGRVVYVTSSIYGMFGHSLAAHFHGKTVRHGVRAKVFDRISIYQVPEDLLDHAVAAIIRLLRPAENRVERRAAVADEGEQLKRDRDLLGRAGLRIVGWRGASEMK